MNTSRRTFHAFLLTQRDRSGMVGKITRELLATKRRFTPFTAFQWMLTGTVSHFDDEYDALSKLVAEYERARESA
jgi:hypothetical protein